MPVAVLNKAKLHILPHFRSYRVHLDSADAALYLYILRVTVNSCQSMRCDIIDGCSLRRITADDADRRDGLIVSRSRSGFD